MNSGEIIQIHVGQAGIQMGNACWELYCLEHGINLDGTVSCEGAKNITWNAFFNCTSCGNVVPRLIMVDSEAVVLDEIKAGPYNKLYKCNTLICGNEDTGNNFARGYNTVADDLLDTTMDALRKLAEECPRLDGFFMLRSINGGTGSGLGTKILERITDCYGIKANKLEFTIYPSPCMSPVVVQALNAILAIHGASDLTDSTFVISNEALYNIFDKKLAVECPTYTNINRIIAQVVSSITAGMRFDSPLGIGIREFKTNLVPFPRIHYSVCSYAPILSNKRPCQDSLSTHKITTEALERDNTLADVNLCDGLLMAAILLYRGNMATVEVSEEIQYIKSKYPQVSWNPSPLKSGLSNCSPTNLPWGDLLETPRALCMLSNNTAIRHFLGDILLKYKTLVEKRAFLFHYFGEGLEESSIIEAGDNVCALINELESLNEYRCPGGETFDNSDYTASIVNDQTSYDQTSENMSHHMSVLHSNTNSQAQPHVILQPPSTSYNAFSHSSKCDIQEVTSMSQCPDNSVIGPDEASQ